MNTLDALNTLNTFTIPIDQFFDLQSTQIIEIPATTGDDQIITLPVLTFNQPFIEQNSPQKIIINQPNFEPITSPKPAAVAPANSPVIKQITGSLLKTATNPPVIKQITGSLPKTTTNPPVFKPILGSLPKNSFNTSIFKSINQPKTANKPTILRPITSTKFTTNPTILKPLSQPKVAPNQPNTKPVSPPKPVLTQAVQTPSTVSQNSVDTNSNSNNTEITTINNIDGNSVSKNTIYKEKMTLKEGVIIQQAFESLRQILQSKKEKLDGLIDQCYQVGKVEYKMTIDSAPVRPDLIINKLNRYEQKYLHDFRRLLLSNNAMEKLYSELLAGKTIKKVVAHAKMVNPLTSQGNQSLSQAHQNLSPDGSIPGSPDGASNISSLLLSPSFESKPPPPSLTSAAGQRSLSKLSAKRARLAGPKSKLVSKPIAKPVTKPVAKPVPRKKIISRTTISPCRESPEPEPIPQSSSTPSPVKKASPKKDPIDDKYHCEFCSKAFHKVQSLNIHLEFDHPPSTRMTISSPENSPIRSTALCLECGECRKTFRSQVLYNIHLETFHYGKKKSLRGSVEHSYSKRKGRPPGRGLRGKIGNRKRGRPRVSYAGRKRSASEATLSDEEQFNNPYSYREPFYDPEIPLECSQTNPVVLITPLSQDIIDAYRRSIEPSEDESEDL